jgi:hypothetical protein
LQFVLQSIDLSQETWVYGPGGVRGRVKLLAQWYQLTEHLLGILPFQPAVAEQTLDFRVSLIVHLQPIPREFPTSLSTTGGIIDFYGPCDASPTGAAQVQAQRLDEAHGYDCQRF